MQPTPTQLSAIRTWIIEQRGKPERIPAAVREDRDERERFARLMKTIGGEADGE